MAVAKNSIDSRKYRLPGVLKKNGFLTHRFFFTGFEKITNVERKFFIEVCQLNPALSPLEPVLGFESRIQVSESALQYALAGTESADAVIHEHVVQPSYIVVRAGTFGAGAKQVCQYYAAKTMTVSRKKFLIEADNCTFKNESLLGKISCAENEVIAHPEYFCDSGTVSWNIHYTLHHDTADTGYCIKTEKWFPIGGAAEFFGTIVFDGCEYRVIEETSSGVIDVSCGRTYPLPLVHIASSHLTSIISGKRLENSCFAVHGEYGGGVALFASFDARKLVFRPHPKKSGYTNQCTCVIMPEDEAGEKLHWSVSVSNRQWIVDVDIFCPSKELMVREFELPEGNKKTVKVLGGGTGSGEIKLYRRLKKNSIELIEHARVENALCEYGRGDEVS
ncbi:MAG: hypothetical protein IJ191_02925 [Treponema sp.]|nr:hypothetical protein [Treponema sp.]